MAVFIFINLMICKQKRDTHVPIPAKAPGAFFKIAQTSLKIKIFKFLA